MWNFLFFLNAVFLFQIDCLAQSKTLEAGICDACTSENTNLKKLKIEQEIDEDFVKLSSGKIFSYKSPDKPDGEPNCVAAALRAGGYLPAFVINGTDVFYEKILPDCFRKVNAPEKAEKGDIGIEYLPRIPTLAHAYLYLDSKTIFHKASPKNSDAFMVLPYTLVSVSLKETEPEVRTEIWRFNPQSSCILMKIKEKFNLLPESSLEKKIRNEIDQRIYSGDWTSPITSFSKKEFLKFKKSKEREVKEWFRSLPGGFKKDRDYKDFLEKSFTIDLVKTIERTPMFDSLEKR